MMREWPLTTRLAGAVCAAAVLLDVVLVVRSLQSSAAGTVVAPLTIRSAPQIVVSERRQATLMRQASARLPFGGTAATPGTLSAAPTQQIPGAFARRPRLVGTVVEERGGFVIVEMPDARMQVVRVGERAGDLRLTGVKPGEASFEDAHGARVTLRSTYQGTESRP